MNSKSMLLWLALSSATCAQAISLDMSGDFSGNVYSSYFDPYFGSTPTDYWYQGNFTSRNPSVPPHFEFRNTADEMVVASEAMGHLSYGGAGHSFHYSYRRATHLTDSLLLVNEAQLVRIRATLTVTREICGTGTQSVTSGQISLMNGSQAIFNLSSNAAGTFAFDQVVWLNPGQYSFGMSSSILPNGGGAGPEGVSVTGSAHAKMWITAVPEPTSMPVLGVGLIAMLSRRKR